MNTLRVPALQLTQGPGRKVYSFGVDGKQLQRIAAVSRIRRDDASAISGYQRPEVLAHIRAIRSYIESETPMIPNGIVVAFDARVSFEQHPSLNGGSVHLGDLVIPLDEEERPGWIVDGQQRAAAIRDASVDTFPVFVNAFITEDVAEQRAQFILVNSTKPLPKGLIHELLPSTEAPLPPSLHRKRLPALLLEHLNYDKDSPFYGRIRTPTTTDGLIKDNSVLKMLENSISDGALYPYRLSLGGRPDTATMLVLVKRYWTAVAQVFVEAWDKPPRQSRLTHGLGIIGLGFLMDAIVDQFPDSVPDVDDFARQLELIAGHCAWTNSSWHFSSSTERARPWNELQNTPRDVQLVADHLLTVYRQALNSRDVVRS